MENLRRPHVVLGVDGSLTGLAALRTAVVEARRRGLPLYAVRARTNGIPGIDQKAIRDAFFDALGAIPTDLEVHFEVVDGGVLRGITSSATHPGDLIVVGNSGRGIWHAFWSGSVCRGCLRRAHCAVLAVPAPEAAHGARARNRWHPRRRDLWDRFEHETAHGTAGMSGEARFR